MVDYCIRTRRASYIKVGSGLTSIYFMYLIDGVPQLGGAFRRNKEELDKNYFSVSRWEI